MKKTRKLNAFNYGLLQGLIFTLLGFAIGLLYAVGGFISDLLTTGLNLGTLLAFLAVIGIPVTFGVIGFATGWVGGLLFNFATLWMDDVQFPIFQKDSST